MTKPATPPDLLEHILEVSRRLAELRSLTLVLDTVADEAMKLTSAERVYVVLKTADGSLKFEVKRDKDGHNLSDDQVQISRSVLHKMFQTRQPLIATDAINDPDLNQAKSVVALQLRSIMGVPLIAQGDLIGAIYVEHRKLRNHFNPEDLLPLELFANHAAAVAVSNAILNAELEQRVATRTQELEQRTRELEEARRRMAQSWSESVEANRIRTVWLSNFAHDMRAPLSIVSAALSALEFGTLGPLSTEQLEWVNKSLNATRHVNLLITNLFELFKLESGKLKLHREVVDLHSLLAEAYDIASVLPWARGVHFDLEITETLPPVTIDPVRIRQVIINLISNAQKFTQQGSVILYARQLLDQHQILIGVFDTGEGIPADRVPNIFERFHYFDPDLSQQRTGSGLGLIICRDLVSMHGGRIWVESKVGEGSNFMFTLPVTQPG